MQQTIVDVPIPGGDSNASLAWGTNSLLPALFAIAGQAIQPGREERQLASVIHQLYWNEKARRKLLEDPETFILALKVLPQVKAVLGMMKASLLAGRVLSPEFNWWWGKADPETVGGEELSTGTGSPSHLSFLRPCTL
jgi:hypothetical protein